jgi:hypothetical protein
MNSLQHKKVEPEILIYELKKDLESKIEKLKDCKENYIKVYEFVKNHEFGFCYNDDKTFKCKLDEYSLYSQIYSFQLEWYEKQYSILIDSIEKDIPTKNHKQKK